MKSVDIKKLYLIHSWVGLVTGILLFVIAFTGALSVFGRPEIKIWANPDIRTPPSISAAAIERVIEKHAAEVPEHYREEILVYLPGTRAFTHLTILFENHEEQQAVLFVFDNNTLELIDKKEGPIRELFADAPMDIADFVVHFHADLHLGRPVGLLTTGLLGLTLLASVVTGFIIHRKKLANLFTFRRRKSFDVTLADSHKIFGIWGMIFYGVISFTGAFLGLAAVILIPAAAFVSFGGDQAKLVETFNTAPEPIVANVAAKTQIATVLDHAVSYDEDMRIELVRIYAYGDKNAKIYANGVGSEQVARLTMAYEGSTGKFQEAFGQFGKVGGFSAQVLDLMFPLHFGNFGGAFVKLIWTILGIATALLPLSGLMLWIERGLKSQSPQFSRGTYQRFNQLVVGSCGGVILASAALFPTQVLLQLEAAKVDSTSVIFSVFFAVWAVAIVAGFITKNTGITAKWLSYITAVLLLITIPLNTVVTGDNFVFMLLNGQWVAGITELTLFVLGVLTVVITHRLANKTKQTDASEQNVAPSSPSEQSAKEANV